MKRICALLLALLLAAAPALAENVEDALVIGMLSTRTLDIDPLNPQEASMLSLYALVYESLVTIDDNGVPQPLLAEKWSETGNGKTWTFSLRKDIYFSDGSPLTAADVAASLQYLLDMANNAELPDNGYYQSFKYNVTSVSAPEEHTVQVKTKRPYYGLLYAMTFPVVPAGYVGQPNAPGTGPYQIVSFSPQAYMNLTARDGWWQQTPQVKTIQVSFFPNNKEMITAYEYGRVDTVFTRSVSAAQYKSGINSLSIPYSTRQLELLMLNNREDPAYPLDNANIRKAIRYALDINAISENVYMGMTNATESPVASNSWLYYDQSAQVAFSREKAAKLLEDEGWSDIDGDGILDKVISEDKVKHLVLRLFVYEDPENNVRYETANRIADMLGALKIKVNITAKTYDEAVTAMKDGKYDMCLCAMQMDVVPDAGFMLMKRNTGNYMGYSSSAMNSLCETLRVNVGQADFAYTWQSIQQQFVGDMPFIPLFYRTGAVLTRKMYTTVRDIREFELLRGIEAFGR